MARSCRLVDLGPTPIEFAARADLECIATPVRDKVWRPRAPRDQHTLSVHPKKSNWSNIPKVRQCPLWVISGHFAMSKPCPLYPRKRTLAGVNRVSAKCQ